MKLHPNSQFLIYFNKGDVASVPLQIGAQIFNGRFHHFLYFISCHRLRISFGGEAKLHQPDCLPDLFGHNHGKSHEFFRSSYLHSINTGRQGMFNSDKSVIGSFI